MQKPFRDQLKTVRASVLGADFPHNPGQWLREGVDHINIARNSNEAIGRMLNLDFIRHWEHPVLGPFRSLNSLWFFLKAKVKPDEIRSMTGFELKNFVHKECGGFSKEFIPNFRAAIMDSAYRRILTCGDIKSAMIASTLPFDSYRELDSGVRMRFEHSAWFVGGYEEIRRALKEDREPDFKYLLDTKDSDIYSKILSMLRPEVTEDQVKAALARLNDVVVPKKPKKPKKPKNVQQAPAVAEVAPVPVYDASKIQDIDAIESAIPMAEAPPEVAATEFLIQETSGGFVKTPTENVDENILAEATKDLIQETSGGLVETSVEEVSSEVCQDQQVEEPAMDESFALETSEVSTEETPNDLVATVVEPEQETSSVADEPKVGLISNPVIDPETANLLERMGLTGKSVLVVDSLTSIQNNNFDVSIQSNSVVISDSDMKPDVQYGPSNSQ